MGIRKNDIVVLPDGSEGKVLSIVLTGSITVYKIRKDNTVEYFEAYKVRLKKRHFLNAVLALFVH